MSADERIAALEKKVAELEGVVVALLSAVRALKMRR